MAFFLVWNVNYKVAVVLSFLDFGFVVYFNIRYNGTDKETSWLVKMVFTLSLQYTCSFAHEILLLFTLLFRVSMQQRFHIWRRFNFEIRWNIWPLMTLKYPISKRLILEKPFGIIDWHTCKDPPDIMLLLTRYIRWLWWMKDGKCVRKMCFYKNKSC